MKKGLFTLLTELIGDYTESGSKNDLDNIQIYSRLISSLNYITANQFLAILEQNQKNILLSDLLKACNSADMRNNFKEVQKANIKNKVFNNIAPEYIDGSFANDFIAQSHYTPPTSTSSGGGCGFSSSKRSKSGC